MESILNALLATVAVSSSNTQTRHWLLTGENYATWHPLFAEIYDRLNDAKDKIAEIMVQRGIIPVHNMTGYLAVSVIADSQSVPDWRTQVSDMSKELGAIIGIINTNAAEEEFDGACDSDLTNIAADLYHYKMMCDRTLTRESID